MSSLTMALLLLLSLLVVAFFAGAETAVISANRIRLAHRTRKKDKRAQRALRLLYKPEKVVTTTLVGTNFGVVAASTLTTALALAILPDSWANSVPLITSLVLAPVLMVLGDLLPKAVGRSYSDRLTPALATPLRVFGYLFWPIGIVVTSLTHLLFRLLKITPGESDRLSREELRVMMQQGKEEEAIEHHTAHLADEAFTLTLRRVREVMTPLRELDALSTEASVLEAIAKATETTDSNLCVYQGRASNLVGVVPVKELTRASLGTTVGKIMRRPLFVPEHRSLSGLLADFRFHGATLAVVIDEYKNALGVISLDGVLNSLTGQLPA